MKMPVLAQQKEEGNDDDGRFTLPLTLEVLLLLLLPIRGRVLAVTVAIFLLVFLGFVIKPLKCEARTVGQILAP
jgi:hypothetical protein